MDFNTFIQKSISQKTVLFLMDKGVALDPADTAWSKAESTIWKFQYSYYVDPATTFSYGYGSYGHYPYGQGGVLPPGTGPDPVLPERPPTYFFNGFYADLDSYLKVDDLDECRTTDMSFYFDKLGQILYVNFEDDTNPIDYSHLVAGISTGYSDVQGWYGGGFFEGRVKSIPSISNEKDALYFGKISYDGGSVTLENSDGSFDHLDKDDVYGQQVRILYGSQEIDFDEYKIVFTGYFENFNIKGTVCTIDMRDPRKALSVSLPNNIFDEDTWPGVENIGAVIPLGYGKITKQVAICYNETVEEAVTYHFKFVDTSIHAIQSVENVYVDGKKVTINSVDLAEGTFVIDGFVGGEYTSYEPGAECTVSYTGYAITNPLDILQDLLTIFVDIDYIEQKYNITEWEESKLLVPDINLSITETTTIVSVIEQISFSTQGLFIYQGNGLITFRLRDIEKDIVDTIYVKDQSVITAKSNNTEEYTSSVRVGYNKQWFYDNASYIVDSTKEDELYVKYKTKNERTFDTLLVNSTDAWSFSDNIINQFGGMYPTFTFNTTNMRFINLELEDNINATVWFSNSRYTNYKLEVIGIKSNFTKNTMTITARYIRELTFPYEVVIEFDEDPDYIIEFDEDPNYIIGVE